MSPVTHFLLGWMVANADADNQRRERVIITLAGVAPDVDGLGVIADVLTRHSQHPLNWFAQYHHLFGHNLSFGLVLSALAFFVAQRKWQTALLVFFSFHLHLLGDLVGSRSPDGYQWPMVYLWPFSNAVQLLWNGQWALNGWQNFVITGVALLAVFALAVKRGYSPLEMISASANRKFIETLRRRFQSSK
ncbi:MAG: metal-dependent hydrolase [Acidobacteria bacterium]|nr:metal-dependent hydrolase [Acidobacteriota bacterium]